MMSKEIEMVKNGKLSMCPDYTVGEMVEGFYSSPKWEDGTAEGGGKFVNAIGGMTFQEKSVEGTIQFMVNVEKGAFQFNAFEMNGIPQNRLLAIALLKKMCVSAKTAGHGIVADYSKAKSQADLELGINNIMLACEGFFSDHERYPKSLDEVAGQNDGFSTKDLQSIRRTANINYQVSGDAMRFNVTAKSIKYPDVGFTYDSNDGKIKQL